MKLSNIFYKIQFKSEIETLNLELKRSKCNGFLIPKRHFFDKNEEIDDSFLKTVQSLNKKVILYENYYSERPNLLNPNKLKNDEFKKSFLEKKEEFENKFSTENLESYFSKEIDRYCKIIEFVKKTQRKSSLSEIEQKLFGKRRNFEILFFTIPYLPTLPYKYKNLESYYNKFYTFTDDVSKRLKSLVSKYSKDYDLHKQLFTITFNLDDYLNNRYNIEKILNDISDFENVGLWLIDFNDLTAQKKHIKAYKNLISQFSKSITSLFIYYSGVYSCKFLEKVNVKIKKIVRISGYPGLDINIPAIAPRTKRFFYQENGKFYNPNHFSNELLVKDNTPLYQCNCKVCSFHNINTTKRAFKFYIQNPITNPDYDDYHGRAKKTLEKKLKAKQNSFLIKHNFSNLDNHLHFPLDDIYNMYYVKNKGLPNWKEFLNPKE